MPLTRTHHTALVLAASLAVLAAPRDSQADAKSECVASFDDAQKQRADGKLVAAMESATTCARDACPAVVKKLCAGFVTELEGKLGSIGVEARDSAGGVLSDATIQVDGKALAAGASVRVDPGAHTIHVERAGSVSVDQSVTVKSGETRTLTLVLVKRPVESAPPPPSASAPVPPPTTAPDAPPASSKKLVLPIVFASIGVVGVASFAAFGLMGKSQRSSLASSCAPYCTSDDVSPVRTKYAIADVSLLVGLASLGVATWLFVSAPPGDSSTASALRFDAGAAPGSARVSATGSF